MTSTEARDDRHAAVHAKFVDRRGFWDPLWDPVLETVPDLLDAYIDLSAVPWTTGTLHPRIRELVYVVMNAATTHLYHVGVRVHLRNAIQHGATLEETAAVLALASELGSHGVSTTLGVLADEMRRRGAQVPDPDPTAVEAYTQGRGGWDEEMAPVAALSPEYLTAFGRYCEVTRSSGVLDEATIHLVAIAYTASATHLHEPAVRMHVRRALDAGVDHEQIAEVLQIVGMVGVHTLTDCMVIAAEEHAGATHS